MVTIVQDKIVRINYLGVIGKQDFISSWKVFLAKAVPYNKELVDIRQVTSTDVGYLELEQLAAIKNKFHRKNNIKHVKNAILRKHLSTFGLSRMYGALSDYYGIEEIKWFENEDEALMWLFEE